MAKIFGPNQPYGAALIDKAQAPDNSETPRGGAEASRIQECTRYCAPSASSHLGDAHSHLTKAAA
jgi:hypothetical protein